MTIPVELPSLSVSSPRNDAVPKLTIHFGQILNLVYIAPEYTRAEVGQAVQVLLSIRPTFSWSSELPPASLRLSYDVTTSVDDWLISGRKKGEFAAGVRMHFVPLNVRRADDLRQDVETKIPLTLIPLRPGALFLPSVAIRSLSRGTPISCETQHLNAATVSSPPGVRDECEADVARRSAESRNPSHCELQHFQY